MQCATADDGSAHRDKRRRVDGAAASTARAPPRRARARAPPLVSPADLAVHDRVRVDWGGGREYDGTVVGWKQELVGRTLGNAREQVSVRVAYDDGDVAWVADDGEWLIRRLSAAAAPADDDAPAARRAAR